MSAFDTAMASLIADPHLGCDAEYRQAGIGAPVSLRVLRSSPDRMADAFGTGVISASDILSLAIATLPDLAAGDSFSIGGEVLTVRHAERNATESSTPIMQRRCTDTLGLMLAKGSISQPMHDAGQNFRATFRIAALDGMCTT